MAGDRREFGLQIDVAAKQSASQAFGKPCTHSGFIVMLGLAGRIDTPKTLLDRKRDEALGVSFLPSRPVNNPWHAHIRA